MELNTTSDLQVLKGQLDRLSHAPYSTTHVTVILMPIATGCCSLPVATWTL